MKNFCNPDDRNGQHQQEDTGEINVHDFVPFFRGEVLQQFTNADACIVEEDVDAAP